VSHQVSVRVLDHSKLSREGTKFLGISLQMGADFSR
jgi:hypothetical protein